MTIRWPDGSDVIELNQNQKSVESHDQMLKDSDTIFTAISTSDFDDFNMASQAVVQLYVIDMAFSRAGISHALKRLEQHYSG